MIQGKSKKRFQSLKEFYIDNSQSVLNSIYRPLWLSQLIIVLEHSFCFSMILTEGKLEELMNFDKNAKILKYISLFYLSQNIIDVIVQILLAVHSILLLAICICYIWYIFKPFKSSKSKFLSFYILSFNSLILIPSLLLSLHSSGSFSFGFINYLISILLSVICTYHGNLMYSFKLSDYLQKSISLWDLVKYFGFVLDITLSYAFSSSNSHYIYALIFYIINVFDILRKQLFINKRITKLYLQINIAYFIMIACILISSAISKEKSISLTPQLFLSITLSVKLGSMISDFKYKQIFKIFNKQPSNSSSQNFKGYIIDIAARMLLKNYRFRVKNCKIFEKILFNDQISIQDINEKNEVTEMKYQNLQASLGDILSVQETQTFDRLKNKLTYQFQQFNFSKGKSSTNGGISSLFREIFYLLEIDVNIPRVLILISEIINYKRDALTLTDLSLIQYITTQIKSDYIENGSGFVEINQVFTFENGVKDVNVNFLAALNVQLQFLKLLCDDVLNLELLQKTGIKFKCLRDQIKKQINYLFKINRQSKDLQNCLTVYAQCVNYDDEEMFYLQQQFDFKLKKFHKKNNKYYKNEDQCAIFISFNNNSFGNIKKISQKCTELLGYLPQELLNQNLSTILPNYISVKHNQLIKESIAKGNIDDSKHKQVPLYVRTKNGFAAKVDMDLQLHFNSEISNDYQVGIMCNFFVKEKNKNNLFFVTENIREESIDLISEQLYETICKSYWNKQGKEKIDNVHMMQLVPMLATLKDKFMNSGEVSNKYYIKTLVFFPNKEQNQEKCVKYRTDNSKEGLLRNILDGYYHPQQNDIYLMQLSVYFYQTQTCSTQIIKIKEYQLINNIQLINQLFTFILLPQFKDYYLQTLPDIDQVDEQIFYGNSSFFSKANKFSLVPGIYAKESKSPFSARSQRKSFNQQFSQQISNNVIKEEVTEQDEVTEENLFNQFSCDIGRYRNSTTLEQDLLSYQVQDYPSDRQISPVHLLTIQSSIMPFDPLYSGKKSQVKIPALEKEQLASFQLDQILVNSDEVNKKTKSKTSIMTSNDEEQVHKQSNNRSIQNSISSQQSYLFEKSKRNLVKNLKKSQLPYSMKFLLTSIGILFLGLIVLVFYTFLVLKDQIKYQKVSFQYISYPQTMLNNFLTIMRQEQFYDSLEIPLIGYTTDQSRNILKKKIKSQNQQLLEKQTALLSNINRDFNQINLIQNIFTNQTTYTYITTPLQQSQGNNSIFMALKLTSNSGFLLIYGQPLERMIGELSLFVNSKNITTSLNALQSSQEISVLELQDDINNTVYIFAMTALIISIVVAIALSPIYTFVQITRQKAIGLLATIEPSIIEEIKNNALISINQLLSSPIGNQLSENQNNQLQNNHILNYGVLSTTKNNFYKKKKIASTTQFKKFNSKIIIYIAIIAVLLNIQPQVNNILTQKQIQVSKYDQSIAGNLLEMKSVLQNNQLIAYSYLIKLQIPKAKFVPLSGFVNSINNIIVTNKNTFSKLQTTVQQQFTYNRHSKNEYDSFFFEILQQNACQPFRRYPEYIFSDTFDLNLCQQIQGGVFNQGFLGAVQSFIDIYTNFYNIVLTEKNQNLQLTKLQDFFKRNDIINLQQYILLISDITTSLIEFVNLKNDEFYTQVEETQFWLFIMQTVLVCIIFPFIIIPSFIKIKEKISESKCLLLMLQIKYIFKNTYIMNYLYNEY